MLEVYAGGMRLMIDQKGVSYRIGNLQELGLMNGVIF